jgi:hypothetical protein
VVPFARRQNSSQGLRIGKVPGNFRAALAFASRLRPQLTSNMRGNPNTSETVTDEAIGIAVGRSRRITATPVRRIFADYFSVNQSDPNQSGLGGRATSPMKSELKVILEVFLPTKKDQKSGGNGWS